MLPTSRRPLSPLSERGVSGADKEDGLEISDNEGGSVMTSGVWNQFLRPPSPASTAELEGMVVVVVVEEEEEEEEEEFEEWECMSASGVKCIGISGVRPSPERKKFNKSSSSMSGVSSLAPNSGKSNDIGKKPKVPKRMKWNGARELVLVHVVSDFDFDCDEIWVP